MVDDICLCQLDYSGMKLSCYGCCGHDFESEKEVLDAIHKNTLEYGAFDNIPDFKARFEKGSLRKAGVCRNLVNKNDRVLCPLHPIVNGKKDYRLGHCDTTHECRALFEFNAWDSEMKKKFLDYLLEMDLTDYLYSIGMDSGSFLEDFKKNHINV